MQATSQALLARLFATPVGQSFYMSAEEGSELAANGLIAVDPNATDPTNQFKYKVTITEAGLKVLESQTSALPTLPTTTAPKFEIETGIAIPKSTRGNSGNLKPRTSSYPFDQLEIGQSFHVAVSAEDAEPWKKMASNVSAANARSETKYVDPSTGQTPMVQVQKKTLAKDAAGNNVLDAAGKKTYLTSIEIVEKTVPTKHFVARQVNAKDSKGPGVRVFRVALS